MQALVPSLPHGVRRGKSHAGKVPFLNQDPKETASSKDPLWLLFSYQHFTLPHSPLGTLRSAALAGPIPPLQVSLHAAAKLLPVQ